MAFSNESLNDQVDIKGPTAGLKLRRQKIKKLIQFNKKKNPNYSNDYAIDKSGNVRQKKKRRWMQHLI